MNVRGSATNRKRQYCVDCIDCKTRISRIKRCQAVELVPGVGVMKYYPV